MHSADVPHILAAGIRNVQEYLRRSGRLRLDPEAIAERLAWENTPRIADNTVVRPLHERLLRIFDLDDVLTGPDEIDRLCRAFMEPVFARARIYDDTFPALDLLRRRGLMTAVVSNTPWGSPGNLWREELARLSLAEWIDADVFCTDVGQRKPAPEIYDHAMKALGVAAEQCLFVGDDPCWDVEGPRVVGMDAVLLDRQNPDEHIVPGAIRRLTDLEDWLFLNDSRA